MKRSHAWLPLLALAAQVAIVGVGAQWLDSSDLADSGSWGYVFGWFVLTFLYASWPIGGAFVCALVGSFAQTTTSVRYATLAGAGIAAAFGAVGVVFGLVAAGEAYSSGDGAFGGIVVAASAVAMLPLAVVARPRPA